MQVRYPPNHVFDPFEVSDFEGSAGKNKTAELSIGRPDGEGLPLGEDDHQWKSEREFTRSQVRSFQSSPQAVRIWTNSTRDSSEPP